MAGIKSAYLMAAISLVRSGSYALARSFDSASRSTPPPTAPIAVITSASLRKSPDGERHEVVGDLLAPLAREAPDDAEVEEADAPVAEGHEVARVHVAVEEAVQDHALEPGAHPGEELRLPVDVRRAQLLDVVDAVPEEALHDEDAPASSAHRPRAGRRPATARARAMMRLNSAMLAASRRKSSSSRMFASKSSTMPTGFASSPRERHRHQPRAEAQDAQVGLDERRRSSAAAP